MKTSKDIKLLCKNTEQVEQQTQAFERKLRSYGVPYRIEETKTTVKIIPRFCDMPSRQWVVSDLTPRELSFIARVKKHFNKLPQAERMRPYQAATFFNGFSRGLNPGVFTGFTEIDVSGAYWKAAFNLGYLTEDLYNDGAKPYEREENDKGELIREIGYRKKTRLISLGSLAKKVIVRDFYPLDNGSWDEVIIPPETKETSVFWDNITFYFGLTMQEIADTFPKDIIGYWVDAVFCKTEVSAIVTKAFAQKGYSVKIVPIKRLIITETQKGQLQILRERLDGEILELPPFDRAGERKRNFQAARERFLDGLKKDISG